MPQELPAAERRSKTVIARLTGAQFESIAALARAEGLTKTDLALSFLHDGMMAAHRLGRVDAQSWRNLFNEGV